MELSLFLAQVWGVSFMVIGLGMLLRPEMVATLARDFRLQSFSGYSAGLIIFVVGLVLVLTHNVWDGSWRVIITLFGWATLLKGIGFLFVPKIVEKRAQMMLSINTKWLRVLFVVMIIVGAYLAYVGFGL